MLMENCGIKIIMSMFYAVILEQEIDDAQTIFIQNMEIVFQQIKLLGFLLRQMPMPKLLKSLISGIVFVNTEVLVRKYVQNLRVNHGLYIFEIKCDLGGCGVKSHPIFN